MPEPFFFVFDGVDGAGKTTQIDRFRRWLQSEGHVVTTCRDPGTTLVGQEIRRLLLQSTDVPIGNQAEMLLYMAARAQLVEETIRPALKKGQTVISDRFLLANVVYQGHAGGLDPDEVWQVGRFTTAGLLPTLTILLDLDPTVAQTRREGTRAPDRLERRGIEYFQQVRRGFLAEAELRPQEIVVIDANNIPDRVEAHVRRVTERFVIGGR